MCVQTHVRSGSRRRGWGGRPQRKGPAARRGAWWVVGRGAGGKGGRGAGGRGGGSGEDAKEEWFEWKYKFGKEPAIIMRMRVGE